LARWSERIDTRLGGLLKGVVAYAQLILRRVMIAISARLSSSFVQVTGHFKFSSPPCGQNIAAQQEQNQLEFHYVTVPGILSVIYGDR